MNEFKIDIAEPDPELMREADKLGLAKLYDGLLFHGTGRLHYGYDYQDKSHPNGKLIDILQAVDREGLAPQADHIAKLLLDSAETVSLTRERVYARCYGEHFGEDENGKTHLEYRFGKMSEWQPYFFGETGRAMKTRRNARYIATALKNIVRRFSLEDLRRAADVKHHTKRWLVNKAQVAGNHPLIFGIETDLINCLPLPHGLDFFESRTGAAISPDAVRIIEVPLNKVAEVRRSIVGSGLSKARVVAIEHGEVYSFRRGLAACMAKNTPEK